MQSTVYDNNYSNRIKIDKLIANSITDGVMTFQNGTIRGSVYPTDPNDSVTKEFVDLSSSVAGPENAVQFNNAVFGGNSDLLYTDNTLMINGTLTDGKVSLTSSAITGIESSTVYDPSEIATKAYVDNNNETITKFEIRSDISITYTPEQFTNSIIIRDTETYLPNAQITDITPSAVDIVNALNSKVGNKYNLDIMNFIDIINNQDLQDFEDNMQIIIEPGAGVEFVPNIPIIIPRRYSLNAYVIITNVSTPIVKIIVNKCSLITNPLNITNAYPEVYSLPASHHFTGSFRIKENFIFKVNENIISSDDYMYTTNDVKNQIVTRNPSRNSIDLFDHNIIDYKYLIQIMCIQNISDYSITLTATDLFSLRPDNIIIPPKKQLHLSITKKYPSLTNNGSYYTCGAYTTLGGSGSGLEIFVKTIKSSAKILDKGTGYFDLGSYTTINLTNPNSTGFLPSVSSTSEFGEIDGIGAIVNYLDGGYTIDDIVQVNGGNNDARIQFVRVNEIVDFQITNMGIGYELGDIIEIDNGIGNGTMASFVLDGLSSLFSIGIMGL